VGDLAVGTPRTGTAIAITVELAVPIDARQAWVDVGGFSGPADDMRHRDTFPNSTRFL
jgi:hypothetical protein